MNPIQKAYDSYDKNNRMLKLTNSYYHNRNLGLIHNRKYQITEPVKSIHKRRDDPIKQYYIERDNEDLGNKLKEIRSKPTKPKMNDFFISHKEKLVNFNKNVKKQKQEEIDRENEEMYKRMKIQKTFINTKDMDDDYATNHQKMIKKLKKMGDESCVLPRVTDDKFMKKNKGGNSNKNKNSNNENDNDNNGKNGSDKNGKKNKKNKKDKNKKNQEEEGDDGVAYKENEETDDKQKGQCGPDEEEQNKKKKKQAQAA